MGKKRRIYTKKALFKMTLTTIFLLFLIAILGYIIIETDYLDPSLNELTASYISLNDVTATDRLKITNLSKQTTKKGSSSNNKSFESFNIYGEKSSKYEVVLYRIGQETNNENIMYYLENTKEKKVGCINELPTREDGGKVIYSGTIKEKEKFIIRMWVKNNAKEDAKHISYEIKIKTS